jgi:hypothetical protein
VDDVNKVMNIPGSGRIIETEKFNIEIPKLNYIDGGIEILTRILDTDEIGRMTAKPRPENTTTPRPKTPWKFEKSFFT